MKRKDEDRGPHLIPIPPVLLAQLKEWRAADGQTAALVCAEPRDAARSVTPEGVEKFYRDALRLQGKQSPHSWRSAFSTIFPDAGQDGEMIEAQLDHVVGDDLRSTVVFVARKPASNQ